MVKQLSRYLHEELLLALLATGGPEVTTRTTSLERLVELGLPEREPYADP